jgi:O-antigen/teichoic acid export membrane protein
MIGFGSAARRTLAYGLALVVGKGIAFVMMPIVTRALTPAEFGALEVLIAMIDVGGVLLGLGLADTLFRFASGNSDRVSANLLGIALVMAVLAGGAMQLAAPLVLPLMPGPIDLVDLRIIAVTLALTTFVQVPLAWLRFHDAASTFLAVEAARAVIGAGATALLLGMGHGLTAVLAGGLVGNLAITLLLGLLQARRTRIELDPALVRTMLVYGLPLVLSGTFGFLLGSFDRWILARHVGLEELAIYGIAARFALLASLAMQPFEMWWYPRRLEWSRTSQGLERSRAIVQFACALAVAVVVGAMLAGPFLIRILTPADYHGAITLLPALLLVRLLTINANLLNVGCYAQRTTILPMAINGAAALVVVLGYLLLVPAFGLGGCIASLILGQAVRLLVFTIASQRLMPMAHRFSLIAIAALPILPLLLPQSHSSAGMVVLSSAIAATGIILAVSLNARALVRRP